ncbi:MAG: hypothetical protein RR239_06290 [Oscillospiraceae bacterium]
MYLNKLSNEQKELFLDICIHAAMSNTIFSDEERETIDQYCDEMKLNNVRYEAIFDFKTAVSKLIEISSRAELKIVALELTALIISDKKYDDYEREVMNYFISQVGIDENNYNEVSSLLNELWIIYSKINDFVFNS